MRIKSAVSAHNVSHQIFMIDDTVMFKNAWEDIFGSCSKYLLCAWHVDRAWQNHLNCLHKDISKDIYMILKCLMHGLDEEIQNYASELLKQLNFMHILWKLEIREISRSVLTTGPRGPSAFEIKEVQVNNNWEVLFNKTDIMY